MVNRCCIKGCKSTWTPGSSIKFHRFPANIRLRNHWLSVMKLKTTLYKHAKVCSLHFKSTDYDTEGNRLKHDAVPTNEAPNSVVHKLHPAAHQEQIFISELEMTDSCSNVGELRQEVVYVSCSPAHNGEEIVPDSEMNNSCSNNDGEMEQVTCKEKINTTKIRDSCGNNVVKQVEQEIPSDPKDYGQYCLLNLKQLASDNVRLTAAMSPLDKSIQADLTSSKEILLQKRNKVLLQKVGRLTKQVQSMSSVIAAIKKYFGQSEIENIISGDFADIQKKLYRRKKIPSPHGVRFSDEVRNFATTLHFHSPQAYDYVKKYFPLPHPQTLKRTV